MAFFETINKTTTETLTATSRTVVTAANTVAAVTAMAEVAAVDSLAEQLDGRKMSEVRAQVWDD